MELTRLRRAFTDHLLPAERARLAGYYGLVALTHLVGWGLAIWLSFRHPALIGLGALAYGFGIRHAFDADHISAIDNVTRKLVHSGKDPMGTGFYFSLGHSSVVFLVAAIIGISSHEAVAGFAAHSPWLTKIGGLFGTGISGLCLVGIGLLNLVILLDLYRSHRHAGGEGEASGKVAGSAPGGFLVRLFGRLFRFVKSSRQMFFVGFLFGLGFDTASEVALLAISAGASSAGMSLLAVLSLPLLFAAGMVMMDTTDAVLMSKAYTWSFANPLRGSIYNLTVTGLSVAVALTVGTIELLRVVDSSPAGGWAASLLDHIGSWSVGLVIVTLFAVVWATTAFVQKRRNSL